MTNLESLTQPAIDLFKLLFERHDLLLQNDRLSDDEVERVKCLSGRISPPVEALIEGLNSLRESRTDTDLARRIRHHENHRFDLSDLKLDLGESDDGETLTVSIDPLEHAFLALAHYNDTGESIAMLRSDDAMAEALEHALSNCEKIWVNSAWTGDFTDAPMLGVVDHEDLTCSGDPTVIFRWAWKEYAFTSFLEELLTTGQVRMTGGRLADGEELGETIAINKNGEWFLPNGQPMPDDDH